MDIFGEVPIGLLLVLVHRVDPGPRILVEVKVRRCWTEGVDHLSGTTREIVEGGVFTGRRFRSGVVPIRLAEQESKVVFYSFLRSWRRKTPRSSGSSFRRRLKNRLCAVQLAATEDLFRVGLKAVEGWPSPNPFQNLEQLNEILAGPSISRSVLPGAPRRRRYWPPRCCRS